MYLIIQFILAMAIVTGMAIGGAWTLMLLTSMIGHITNYEPLTLVGFNVWFWFTFAVIITYLVIYGVGGK